MIAHSFGVDWNELSGTKSLLGMFKIGCHSPLCNSHQLTQPPLALAVPLSRFKSRVGGGSALVVRRHSRVMKYRISQIFAALLIFLFIGCSKHSPVVADLGVVEISDGVPIRHDLGGGKTCVIIPTVITNGSARFVRMRMVIEQPNSTGAIQKLACPSCQVPDGGYVDWMFSDVDKTNPSPEPMPFGSGHSAFAVYLASRHDSCFLSWATMRS
jgi:hypothetical protein